MTLEDVLSLFPRQVCFRNTFTINREALNFRKVRLIFLYSTSTASTQNGTNNAQREQAADQTTVR